MYSVMAKTKIKGDLLWRLKPQESKKFQTVGIRWVGSSNLAPSTLIYTTFVEV